MEKLKSVKLALNVTNLRVCSCGILLLQTRKLKIASLE